MGQDEQVGQGRRGAWRVDTWAWYGKEEGGFYSKTNRRLFKNFKQGSDIIQFEFFKGSLRLP